jgi:hypothetical protein
MKTFPTEKEKAAVEAGKRKYAQLEKEEEAWLANLYAKSSADRKKLRLTPEEQRFFDERLRRKKAKLPDEERKHQIRVQKSPAEIHATGLKTLAGMAKGRETRWGDTGQWLGKVQSSFNDQRQKCPARSNNLLIRYAAEECEVSKTFIRDNLRNGKLTIPPKP